MPDQNYLPCIQTLANFLKDWMIPVSSLFQKPVFLTRNKDFFLGGGRTPPFGAAITLNCFHLMSGTTLTSPIQKHKPLHPFS
jgi:hypothetical protein